MNNLIFNKLYKVGLMKKIFSIILFFITINSINSLAKYTNNIEYNFLSVNILPIEYSNTSLPSLTNYNSPKKTHNSNNNYYVPKQSFNLNINSDIFVDTNTNIQIQINK